MTPGMKTLPFFSIPVLPGQRRQRHDPSRWTYGVNTVQHGSPRSGSPSRSSQGSLRWFLTSHYFWHVKNHRKDPRFIQVHQASSRSITVALRFNPRYSPVHPGPWTGVNRGVPGAQWDWCIYMVHQLKIQSVPIVMKPGSLDSSGDVEYYGFYIFALPFLVLEILNF